MSNYMVIVEADLRTSNMNYKIRHSAPMLQAEAQVMFDRVIRGEVPELLKAKDNVVLVRTAENQVCRFWTGITKSESMDRITLAEVIN